MKVCTNCRVEKPLAEFSKQTRAADGLQWNCKECMRWRKISLRYNIGRSEFSRMFQNQEGQCDICGAKFNLRSRDRKPNVDHCHRTGKVRGLLCTSCNFGIGMLKDSEERLESALAYIRKHKR